MDISTLYLTANKNLVAKAIGELSYEENIQPMENDTFVLPLDSGVKYEFKAIKSIWTSLTVNASSVIRVQNGNSEEVKSAAQFFIDAKKELLLTDIVLANFIEEMNNTLIRDIHLLKKRNGVRAATLLKMSEVERESYLNGHPKALLNKGRIGWNIKENQLYSPEESEGFKLHWLAVKRDESLYLFSETTSEDEILSESLDSKEMQRLLSFLEENNVSRRDYLIIPAHPWQWENIIQTQFLFEIANKSIIPLGIFGDTYRPQVSLRTLSNITRPSNIDIKVPLTILNTSAIRGLPSKYIKIGVTISDYLEEVVTSDPILKEANVAVIKERAGASFKSPFFSQIEEAPYRYHEYLGVTWRESIETLNNEEKEISSLMTGNLLFVDDDGNSLISALIEKSRVDTSYWLSLYFKNVVIPLYHLQNKYGFSLVSHGQNIILRTKNSLPYGVAIKDFGGDLRISDEHKSKYKDIPGIENLGNLPAAHLIHDLYTGHMVTLLRFVSGILRDSHKIEEIDFYSLLAKEVEEYNTNNPPPKEINLLREKFERVIINTVRFQIGYGDSSERPIPKLGTDLDNPIFLGYKSRQ
ncbi:IucA/IucC family protein [Halobacteriovorax sp. JY17]|uniref:IucA/IucC family protein n=1 Tax=Halobacteriovorax sp. JY17 TaxID=2014617 RepID=UPI000C358F58|nr:IucA/IucC family protein [Halobacteriovorax sp. JY17]PIK14875.1 MAG: siderophore biosynthesis protein IucC [Halobacteriovorax sp. JY17]